MKQICKIKDSIIDAEYELVLCNAQKISKTLKQDLASLDINYEEFNSDINTKSYRDTHDSVKNPPEEIYEYQNFFLLKREDGKLILLDGFRRLLWYNTPNKDILVRIYDKKELTDVQILKILIHLNHTKFFGGIGTYFDRGFSLAFKSIFDLDILKYSKVLDAYLSDNKIVREYSSYGEKDGENKNQEILNRIVSDKFIQDMKFVQGLNNKKIMLNSNFGVLLWNMRQENADFNFSHELFLEKCIANKYVCENYAKFLKCGDNNSSESQKVINRMIELYTDIFNQILGKESKKTYLEVKEDAKNVAKKLSKDKSLIKITNTKQHWKMEDDLFNFIKEKKYSPKISVVVYPYDDSKGYSDRTSPDTLPAGLYEDFFLKEIKLYSKTLGGVEKHFVFVNKKENVVIRRNLVNHGAFSFSSNYDGVRPCDDSKSKARVQDADVFIDMNNLSNNEVIITDKTKKR